MLFLSKDEPRIGGGNILPSKFPTVDQNYDRKLQRDGSILGGIQQRKAKYDEKGGFTGISNDGHSTPNGSLQEDDGISELGSRRGSSINTVGSTYSSILPSSLPPEPQFLDNGMSNAPSMKDSCLYWCKRLGSIIYTTVIVAIMGIRELFKVAAQVALTTSMSSTGFVTFTSLEAASSASQLILCNEVSVLETMPAPEPRDIVWENLSVPSSFIYWRVIVTSGLVMFLSIFWMAAYSLIYTLSYVIAETFKLCVNNQFNPNYDENYSWIIELAVAYIPFVLLLGLLCLLPWIFYLISIKYEKLKTYSEIQQSVFSRYFYYQLINIFVTITITGSITQGTNDACYSTSIWDCNIFGSNTNGDAAFQDFKNIMITIAQAVQGVGIYFIQLIITKTFSVLLLEFTRLWPLIQLFFVEVCTDRKKKTERELRHGVLAAPAWLYGWTYPSLLLVLMIALTYDVIIPITLLFAALYFFLAQIVYTFHACYVYVPYYESGGTFFFTAFSRTLMALFFAQLILITYIILTVSANIQSNDWDGGSTVLYLFCLLLPIQTVIFYWHCNSGYYLNSLKLSRIAAVRMDEDIRLATQVKKEGLSPKKDPVDFSDSVVPFPEVNSNISDSDDDSSDSDKGENSTDIDIQSHRIAMRAAKKKKEAQKLNIITQGFERSAYAQKCISEKPKAPEPFEYYSNVSSAKALTVGSLLNRSGGEAAIRKSPSKIYDSQGEDLSTSLINPNSDLENGDGYTSPISASEHTTNKA